MSANPRRYRPGLRLPAVLYVSAALLVSSTAGWYTFGGEELSHLGGKGPSSPSAAAGTEAGGALSRPMDLPWPTEGQSSAEVEGIGSLGTRGQLKLARAVMKNEAFRQIVATPTTTAPGVGVQIRNSNRLLGQDGVMGLKTGSSTPAGGNLMWAATKEIEGTSHLILGVVLHQQAGTNPTQAMAAAFNASHTLITAIRSALPLALAGR
ncbi:hypothetical protein [Streptomyces tanashiensis]|uniref:hypothetical protein n=1 Tax=Streptomyces tanashiensis TaxID=67367 RepID=UPI00167E66E3|nr:hypothetical protein [Streptomyces tanashiensis]GGY15785.1 hypothetical protein GCM10010299_20560 [Streptomyces tanashiensis]